MKSKAAPINTSSNSNDSPVDSGLPCFGGTKDERPWDVLVLRQTVGAAWRRRLEDQLISTGGGDGTGRRILALRNTTEAAKRFAECAAQHVAFYGRDYQQVTRRYPDGE